MNLLIDIGNTRIKYACYENDRCIINGVVDEISEFSQIIHSYNIKRALIASVRGEVNAIARLLEEARIIIVHFNASTPVPIAIDYHTPKTLGLDRVAAAVGALQFSNANKLIIDAGTCLTVDFVKNNVFEGGVISPGIQMRYKAMHNFTAKLPLLTAMEYMLGTNPGKSTQESMEKGVLDGILWEVKGYIQEFNEISEDFNVIITGGDAFFFETNLKESIFVCPNLVFDGLNRILNYNVEV